MQNSQRVKPCRHVIQHNAGSLGNRLQLPHRWLSAASTGKTGRAGSARETREDCGTGITAPQRRLLGRARLERDRHDRLPSAAG